MLLSRWVSSNWLTPKIPRPAKHGVEMGVGRMRRAAQAIADPQIHALIKRGHVVGQLMEIDRIAKGPTPLLQADAERGDPAVRLVDERSVASPSNTFSSTSLASSTAG